MKTVEHQILHCDCLLRFDKHTHAQSYLFGVFVLLSESRPIHLIRANICFVRISNAFYYFQRTIVASRYHFMHRLLFFLLSSTPDGVSNIRSASTVRLISWRERKKRSSNKSNTKITHCRSHAESEEQRNKMANTATSVALKGEKVCPCPCECVCVWHRFHHYH